MFHRKTKKKTEEPGLCSDCPLLALFGSEVEKESWNNQPAEDTNLKLCARLRAAARKRGIRHGCKHFNYGLGHWC